MLLETIRADSSPYSGESKQRGQGGRRRLASGPARPGPAPPGALPGGPGSAAAGPRAGRAPECRLLVAEAGAGPAAGKCHRRTRPARRGDEAAAPRSPEPSHRPAGPAASAGAGRSPRAAPAGPILPPPRCRTPRSRSVPPLTPTPANSPRGAAIGLQESALRVSPPTAPCAAPGEQPRAGVSCWGEAAAAGPAPGKLSCPSEQSQTARDSAPCSRGEAKLSHSSAVKSCVCPARDVEEGDPLAALTPDNPSPRRLCVAASRVTNTPSGFY